MTHRILEASPRKCTKNLCDITPWAGLYSKGIDLSIFSIALRTLYRLYTLWVNKNSLIFCSRNFFMLISARSKFIVLVSSEPSRIFSSLNCIFTFYLSYFFSNPSIFCRNMLVILRFGLVGGS